MWKTLMIIAIITALVQWILFIVGVALGSTSFFVLTHAVLWTTWASFCFYRHKTEDEF